MDLIFNSKNLFHILIFLNYLLYFLVLKHYYF